MSPRSAGTFAEAHREVVERLRAHAVKEPYEYNGLRRMGLAVPVVRRELKRGYSFDRAHPDDVLTIWDRVWRDSPWYEAMHQALYYYQSTPPTADHVRVIATWTARCCCWEHSDDLSKIFARIVEDDPDSMMPTLRTWSDSPSMWERRLSLVSLIEYARSRSTVLPFEELAWFVDKQLADAEHYVQKAVGWTLREMSRVYPEQTLTYVGDHVTDLSAIAYPAATAAFSPADKAKLRERRTTRRAIDRQSAGNP